MYESKKNSFIKITAHGLEANALKKLQNFMQNLGKLDKKMHFENQKSAGVVMSSKQKKILDSVFLCILEFAGRYR